MRKLVYSILVSFLVCFFLFASSASAKVLSNENGTVTVAKGEIVNDDLFVNAQTAEINGVVNGDVFIGAQTVRITGTINGSLHIGGQSISLDGTVKGNVYAGAQNITVSGSNIGGSLLIGGQNINIDKDTLIGGSLFAGAASLQIDSQVKRNVYVGTGTLNVGENTRIGKDLYYAAGQEGQVNISPAAKVAGTVHKAEAKVPEKEIKTAQKTLPEAFRGLKIIGLLFAYLSATIVGFIYFKLFEKHFTQTSSLVTNSFWKCLGIGFLITIALIPGLIILLVTMVGIPIAGLAFLIFLIYLYLSKIVVGSALGNWLTKRFNWKMSTYKAFTIGLLVIYIVNQIPFIGGLTGFIVFLTGLGALSLQTFAKSK